MKKFIAAFAGLAAVTGTAHAADDPLVFKPSTAWAADYGEDYCRLARDFSNGDKVIALAIERLHPTTMVKLFVVGDSVKLYRGATTLGYNYLPSGDSRQVMLLRSQATDGRQLLVLDGVNIGPDLLAFMRGPGGAPGGGAPAAGGAPGEGDGPGFDPGTPIYNAGWETSFAEGINGLLLTQGTTNPVRIETGPLKEVIGALQDCTYDLLSHWGIDGAKHRTLSRVVVPASGTSLPQGTVAFQDFGKLNGGVNQVRVMVDQAGAPTSCHIHSPSLSESTNKKICNHLMSKAKFTPALDAGGQPMASYWISSPLFMFAPPGA